MTTVICPICHSENTSYLLTGIDRLHGVSGQWPVYRCMDYQVGFLHPIPKDEEISGFYPSTYYAYTPPTLPSIPSKLIKRIEYKLRNRRTDCYAQKLGYPGKEEHGMLMRLVVTIMPPKIDIPPFVTGGTLLDIGCGAGQYLLQMKNMGWQVKGIELNGQAVSAAHTAGLDVTQGTLESLHIEDSSISVARLSDVLEHVPSPHDLLREIRRILEPGGRLQITLPNLDAWTFRLFGKYWFPLEIPRHLYFFNPVSIRNIAVENGFVIDTLRIWPHKEVDVIPSLQYWLKEKHPSWFERLNKPAYWKLIRKVFTLPKLIAHMAGHSSAMTAWLIKHDGSE